MKGEILKLDKLKDFQKLKFYKLKSKEDIKQMLYNVCSELGYNYRYEYNMCPYNKITILANNIFVKSFDETLNILMFQISRMTVNEQLEFIQSCNRIWNKEINK